MEKIYTYTKEEEERINRELGYTKEQAENYFQKQYQYSFGIGEIAGFIRWAFNRQCPHCKNGKLVWKKELTYIGLRLPPNCTKASKYNKTYEVKRILLCPDCGAKFSLCDKRG